MREGIAFPLPASLKGGNAMDIWNLMSFIEYTISCIEFGIVIERYFKRKK